MAEAPQLDPRRDALIVVDVQVDFCPGGALPVPEADRVVGPLNRWLEEAPIPAVATRDWHPPNHCSFQQQGGPWPPHCVQDTPGAELHPRLRTGQVDKIVNKGCSEEEDAYSGFDAPELGPYLQQHGVRRLWVGGLATDYCVRATVLDALERGYPVFVIQDAVRGIEAEPGDTREALEEMKAAGARLVRTLQVLRSGA